MIHVVLESDSARAKIPMQSFNENDDFDVRDLDEEGLKVLAERDYALCIPGLDSSLNFDWSSVCRQRTATDDNQDCHRLKSYGFLVLESLPYEDDKRIQVDTLDGFRSFTVDLEALFPIYIVYRLHSPLTGYQFNWEK